MELYSKELNFIKSKSQQKLRELFNQGPSLKTEIKPDKSLVTEADYYISDLVKETFKKTYPHLHFFSEEDQESFKFPGIVLDPIDGTREFSKRIPECAISLAIMNSPSLDDPENIGWIYNPFTGFEVSSLTHHLQAHAQHLPLTHGLISRTEQEQGLHKNQPSPGPSLQAMGSIALKLGLLAAGSCDFVFSRRPKNVWDIAAGSIILAQRGYSSFQKKEKIKELDKLLYQGPLLWLHSSNENELSAYQEFFSLS